jgi:hypothetical protein
MIKSILFRFALVAILCTPVLGAAQFITAYSDIQREFFVFDNGQIIRLENMQQPVRSFQVGFNMMAYVNNQGQLKIYEKGIARVLSENTPNTYKMLDHLLVLNTGNNLYAYENGRLQNLGAFIQQSWIGRDSLVAFVDQYGNFNIYYRGRTQLLEQLVVANPAVGKNMMFYTNNNDQLSVWYRGHQEVLEVQQPQTFVAGADIGAYVDYFGKFKIYDMGNLVIADAFAPRSFEVGDGVVAWINMNGDFQVFHGGFPQTLEDQPPMWYKVIDELVVYALPGNMFKVFWQGQTYTLEGYIPETWQADQKTVVWKDYMGKLRAWTGGGPTANASDRVVQEVTLYGETVQSTISGQRPQIYCKSKIY